MKPSNVLIADSGSESEFGFAYLTDFGVAQIGGADTSLSTTNAVAGTLDYMAPERFSSRRAGHRADVYALGCVLHEMLTGDKPFPVQSMPEAMHAHIYLDPPRASEAAPGVPERLDEVIARAMAKSSDDQYPTCAEMAADAQAAVADRRLEDEVGPAPLPQALVVTAVAPVPAASSTVPAGVGAVPDSVPPSQGPEAADLTADPATVEAGSAAGSEVTSPGPPPSPPVGAAPAPVPAERPRRRPLAMAAAAVGAAAAITVAVVVADYAASPGVSRADTIQTVAPAAAPAATPTAPDTVAAPVPPAVQGVFAGPSRRNEMTVAIATRGGQVAAYLCDSESVEA